MRRGLPVVLVALAAGGCVTYERGTLAAAATAPLAIEMAVVAERVQGRSCTDVFKDQFTRATDDALRKAPGADALADVSYTFERFCFVVRGTAVRLP